MEKNSGLSSDVDFIKEFEELKLKQRILIETLNRKNKEQDVFGELNKKLDYLVQDSKQKQESEESQKEQEESQNKDILEKLDFLVKIFKEAEQSSSDFNEKEYLDSMSNKLDQQFQDISQRLDALEKKVGTSTKGESSEKSVDSSNVTQGSQDQVTTQQSSSNGQVVNEGSSATDSNTKEVNGTQNSSNANSTAQQQTNLNNNTVTPKKNAGKGTGVTSSGESGSENKHDVDSQEKKNSPTAGSTGSQVPPPPEFSVDENKVENLAKEDSKKKHRWRLFS